MDPTPPTPWALSRRATSDLRRRAIPVLAGAAVLGLAAASLALLGGCADASDPPEETDAVSGTTGSATPDGYPEGPYGADVGEVMPNLAWRGYVDDDGLGLATDGDYVDVELDTVRRGGARWALVHFGTVF